MSRLTIPRAAVIAAFAAVVVLLFSCGDNVAPMPISMSPEAERAWEEARHRVDFLASPPCSSYSGLQVTQVSVGMSREPRIHFVVERRGERLLILSETRALMPFTAIPMSTHWIVVRSGGSEAAGFAGPSGSGSDIAYLRWRKDDITFELSGSLGAWLTETRFKSLAAASMAGCAAG